MPDADSPPLDWALHFATKYGFCVFPLGKYGDGKKPPRGFPWRERSTNDPGEIRKLHEEFDHPTAWGLDCGKSHVAVLDEDNKNGVSGRDSLLDLQLQAGEQLPRTLTSATPRAGAHRTFLDGGRRIPNSAGKIAPGLDIRGDGGYVVLPGSIIPAGRYTVTQNGGVAEIPGWLAELAGTRAEKKPQAPLAEWDLDHNVRRAVEFLGRAEPAVEGAGGDHRTFTVAARLKDLGISEATALELLLDYYNDRCSPPWDVDELRKKVENAYAYAHDRAPGEATADAFFDDLYDLPAIPGESVVADTLEPAPLDIIDWTSFKPSPPPRRWLIEDWIPDREAVLLSGDGGTGKSLVALQLALALGAGVPVFGLQTTPCRVLYLACEDSPEELHRRAHAALMAPEHAFTELSPGRVSFASLVGRDALLAVEGQENRNIIEVGPLYNQLKKTLDAVRGDQDEPFILILDTAADMLGANENARSVVNQFVKRCLGGLVKKYGVTPLVIGHTAKAAGSEYSGSTAWNNSFRVRLFLRHHESEALSNHRVLARAKSNYSEKGEEIQLFWERGSFRVAGAFDESETIAAVDEAVLLTVQAFEDAGNPVSGQTNGGRSLFRQKILGPNGRPISKSDKKDAVGRLLKAGRIREIKNQKHGNGLFVNF